MARKQTAFILNKAPKGEVTFELGLPESTFKLVRNELGEINDGELLIKTIMLSNDASQRSWIQKGLDREQMYVEPVSEGQIMASNGVAEVIESKVKGYAPGDLISGDLGWADYKIIKAKDVMTRITNKSIPLSWNLDVVGITSLTAYFGLLDVAKLKATDTIVISGASGATGSMCVQIAKKIIGCKKVIGISGGSEKCKYVESIGADICVDYKDPNFYLNMKKALGEDKNCDVFFDGVGGKILDMMLTLTKHHGTVVACGSIAGYTDTRKAAVKAWGLITVRRIQVKGFIILDYAKQFNGAVKDILRWIEEGRITVNENTSQIVDLRGGFERIPETWGILYSDQKLNGKLLTKL